MSARSPSAIRAAFWQPWLIRVLSNGCSGPAPARRGNLFEEVMGMAQEKDERAVERDAIVAREVAMAGSAYHAGPAGRRRPAGV